MADTGSGRIGFENGGLVVPDRPVIPFIPGDGIGPEVWEAARPVIDAAVRAAYGGSLGIEWMEVPAGERAASPSGGELLPAATVEAIRRHRAAIKGPTSTPVGGGHRSVNVALRQALDLYANVRTVRYFAGVNAPVRDPAALDVVIFRENTEDVYAGIEFDFGTEGAAQIAVFARRFGHEIPADAGVGIKVISREKSRRLVRAALAYAIAHGRDRVTLVHKGNIMKATEGAFVRWGCELVHDEFEGRAIAAADLPAGATPPAGLVVVNDRIADALFQDLLLKPRSLSVIATTNLNGDYISDACAAQVGGLGLAPGANIGEGMAVFEATHGTAPDIAGKGIANPASMIFSGAMLLEFLGWNEAAAKITNAVADVLKSGRMTPDLASATPGARALSTSAFGRAVEEAIT
ncbi:MAG: NADP-dependent isocitrate dehydrogenase [Deltaproteobacteria bacterium]|nr:NADP-dependent isocitrate dehydrogenase [Deltaproteobacteria bacterium]